jgi:hypothetical protein
VAVGVEKTLRESLTTRPSISNSTLLSNPIATSGYQPGTPLFLQDRDSERRQGDKIWQARHIFSLLAIYFDPKFRKSGVRLPASAYSAQRNRIAAAKYDRCKAIVFASDRAQACNRIDELVRDIQGSPQPVFILRDGSDD